MRVVVLRKRDFLDLDNPLLAWMMDYDAVAAVLKALPPFQKLKQEQMEQVLDRCGRGGDCMWDHACMLPRLIVTALQGWPCWLSGASASAAAGMLLCVHAA